MCVLIEQWNFYLSGILYGIFKKQEGRIYHRSLDVYTGQLTDWQELDEKYTWYHELGKMDVWEALSRLEEFEAGAQGCLAEAKDGSAAKSSEAAAGSCPRFVTSQGEIFEKKSETEFVQRNIKFPMDLILESGRITAFVTPYRDQCAVLVKAGLEDRTILKQWEEINRTPIYSVKPYAL